MSFGLALGFQGIGVGNGGTGSLELPPSLDLRFADDKAFTVDPANPGGCLIRSRRGPDAAFSRASGATFTDSDGLVKWAPENLAGFSDTLEGSEAAVLVGVTRAILTSGGPTVGRSIVRLTETAVTGPGHYTGSNGVVSVLGQSCTWSVYLKAGSRTKVRTGFYSGGPFYVEVDLSDGSVIQVLGAVIDYLVEDIGNGWWRVSLAGVPLDTVMYCGVNLLNDAGEDVYLGDVTKYLDAYGMQRSRGSTVWPYMPNLNNATYGPRFEHDPVTGESLGLLVEEQRTNYLLNSAVLATQSVNVTAQAYTLSFYGTGTVALSGVHVAVLAGTGAYPIRTVLTFTPTAGSLTLTVTGSVEMAQLE